MSGEPDNLITQMLLDSFMEPPLSAEDAYGAPPAGKKHDREIARRAWEAISVYSAAGERCLPSWVMSYLGQVALRIHDSLGPEGGLSRDAAQDALGLVGKAWPSATPEAVCLTIQGWIDAGKADGVKEGALKFLREENPGNTKAADLEYVIWQYREGRRRIAARDQ